MARRKPAKKQPKQAVCYIMKLPPELRLRIYDFYFQEKLCILRLVRRRTSCKAICAWRKDQSPGTGSGALLRVCRTFHAEAYGVMVANPHLCLILEENTITTLLGGQKHLTTPPKGVDAIFLNDMPSILISLEVTGLPTQLTALQTFFEMIAYGAKVKAVGLTLVGREPLAGVNVVKGMDYYERLTALLDRLVCKEKLNLMSMSPAIAMQMTIAQRAR
ncbi:hypothetical protein EJ03DRAFT_330448 [Teratosphaeria nubilosa]|uniref:Uncharacterized protein n=1 Tax=Teratosphaeria nubilosa TaxID=161662 RepID=A0A6G1L0J6_9PEZI|nr:hypothetical protein EJ03DRAFT_330448 [Teratosphaeria nubilosa]